MRESFETAVGCARRVEVDSLAGVPVKGAARSARGGGDVGDLGSAGDEAECCLVRGSTPAAIVVDEYMVRLSA